MSPASSPAASPAASLASLASLDVLASVVAPASLVVPPSCGEMVPSREVLPSLVVDASFAPLSGTDESVEHAVNNAAAKAIESRGAGWCVAHRRA